MVDGLFGIITHDERVGSKAFGAVLAPFIQATDTCPLKVFFVQDEHMVCLLHQKRCQSTLSFPDRALIKDECRKWPHRWQGGLPTWTSQLRKVCYEQVSHR